MPGGGRIGIDTRIPALAALSAGADRLASEGSVSEALRAVAAAARTATGADLAILRVVEDGLLATRGVAGPPSLVAEIVGSRTAGAPPRTELDDLGAAAPVVQAIAERTNANAVLVVPVRLDGSV